MTAAHDVRLTIQSFVDAFNRGDSAALDEMFEEQGVVVPAPGQPMTGDARRAAQKHLLGFGSPMRAEPRDIYVAGDVALVLMEWSMRGTTPDGHEIDMGGTATDIFRRGEDGRWRYLIDNPFGTVPPSS
ncbi:nuclear transport factor 2 family protein [Kibdelosporangium persicum]|uniref:Ketosteroid isomerase-like n=1 Tax=Kibdelosporangium persicum TaxID=2698649 RepID=A0ABX2EYW0_9PSEU|nr:nuclear transport factor 2 family protein [Kibdelosporangium persicum]NRN64204.1 Ketosteroid isomerase-like [Kibdelosporangium persicum]